MNREPAITMMKKGTLIAGSIALLVISCGGARRLDPGEPSRWYGALAAAKFTEGNLNGALAEYRKALAAASRADLPAVQAKYLFNIGRVNYELGRIDSAENAFSAAYADFRFYRDTARAARAAGYLALVNVLKGRYDSAAAWYGRGRPAELRGNAETAFWLAVQARLCIMNDRMDEAMGYLDRAMESCRKGKMHSGMAQVEYCRAAIACSRSRYDEARAALASSLASLDKAAERYRRWRVLLAASAVAFCLGDREAGTRYRNRAAACAPKGIDVPSPDSAGACRLKWWEH
ncbi:MAG: tetratricopeptide repeat protein [Chitinispirillaceae bacterium]|nr:tetratricopeptide repeat protein [Chitinispirillaceae bacterium]